jgi:AcrR family transcriptional regulator
MYDTVSYISEDGMVRGVVREQAILAAVVDLLGEVGYEAMTMDAVAARAHASKTTIYRRWAGKPELVRAAVDRHVAGRVLTAVDTGSLRGDLHAVMRALRDHLTPEFMAMMGGLMQALKDDPALAASLRPVALGEDAVAEDVIGRAVSRGELPEAAAVRLVPLVHEVMEAQVLRRMMFGVGLDDDFGSHVIDDIVMPLIAGSTAFTPTR